MKVLYITNFLLEEASGATSVAKTHLEVLKVAFGNDNVLTIALVGPSSVEAISDDNVEVIGVPANPLFRSMNLLLGNTGKITNKITKYIRNIIVDKNIELIFFDDSIYGKQIKELKKIYPNKLFVSYYHDVKRNLCIQWIKNNFFKTPVFLSLIHNERLTQKYATYNLVLNEREKKEFIKYYRHEPEAIFPVVLPTPEIDEVDVLCNEIYNRSKPFEITFVGGYYYPNIKGIDWFVSNVLPNLEGAVHLTVVGNNMDRIAKSYAGNEAITIQGRVEDLKPYYLNADVIIGPIFEGAGMKVKTAEALSYGKYFVGTSESLVGYTEYLTCALFNKFIFCCNDANSFVEILNKMINGTIQTTKFCKLSHKYFEEHFSVESAARLLLEIVK